MGGLSRRKRRYECSASARGSSFLELDLLLSLTTQMEKANAEVDPYAMLVRWKIRGSNLSSFSTAVGPSLFGREVYRPALDGSINHRDKRNEGRSILVLHYLSEGSSQAPWCRNRRERFMAQKYCLRGLNLEFESLGGMVHERVTHVQLCE